MRKDDLSSGIIVLVLSFLLFIMTVSSNYDVVPGDSLGSRFFPYLISLFLGFSSIILILNGLKAYKKQERKKETSQADLLNWRRAVGTTLLCFIYTALFIPLGFILATPLFIGSLLMVWKVEHMAIYIFLPIILTALMYYVFGELFSTMLPLGILRGILR